MNKYQSKLSRRAKLIKKKTGLPWPSCKWAAKRRSIFDYVRMCL